MCCMPSRFLHPIPFCARDYVSTLSVAEECLASLVHFVLDMVESLEGKDSPGPSVASENTSVDMMRIGLSFHHIFSGL